ncbi:MAG: PHP domain-containing protein [Clostridia bacterium]|nr:PHP domain-containing protein [Clostridia bacterium]
MRAYYDLHIHSALSPCGDEDMTPNNIVNMALLKGLNVIAVTDHNSCGNVRAVQKVAGDSLIVIPGMEIETEEEVHVLAYFPTVEQAENMEKEIIKSVPPIKNKADIFGRQLYLDENDEIIGEEERLLVMASGLSIEQVFERVRYHGGIPVLAHIDRSSYSVISNLGFIPENIEVSALEITEKKRAELEEKYKKFVVLTSSDAHYLGDISEPMYYFDIFNKTIEEFLDKLTNKK